MSASQLHSLHAADTRGLEARGCKISSMCMSASILFLQLIFVFVIHGVVCCCSGKLAGSDKRAAKEITHAVDSQLSHDATLYHHLANSSSPLGDLHEPATKHVSEPASIDMPHYCPQRPVGAESVNHVVHTSLLFVWTSYL